jgi:hypothetical protein
MLEMSFVQYKWFVGATFHHGMDADSSGNVGSISRQVFLLNLKYGMIQGPFRRVQLTASFRSTCTTSPTSAIPLQVALFGTRVIHKA